jgi:hypothetical protein
VSAATQAARQQSAPPTEKPSASTGIGTQRRPAPAIRAGPVRRRTGTAAQTAAAQVGKRCQLSNRTRHGCIIAHTYDNAPGVAWPTLTSRNPRSPSRSPTLTLTEPHAHPRKGRSGNARNNAYPLGPLARPVLGDIVPTLLLIGPAGMVCFTSSTHTYGSANHYGAGSGSFLRESNPRPTHYEDLPGCVGARW